MTHERWHAVKTLFQAALDRPPLERAAFLAAATGADVALREEVDSLLSADTSEAGFTVYLPLAGSAGVSDGFDVSEPASDPAASDDVAAGVEIGPYQIRAPLGAGGMGEVFLARDRKLHRDVALKLLPRALDLDPDRLVRFRREAQVLAALNHPHIAAIYGLEESSGRLALVLELVDGLTLAERIAASPLSPAETLSIARQVAEALEAAHAKGIVHRDLKPANIKITPSGVVKVLDFGLAKTVGVEAPAVSTHVPAVLDATRVGVVVGTAAYMSPEQARGEAVDARTDIWAFGCVLFEMLAGRKAFAGGVTADERDPDWKALPASTPAKIRLLLRQCLTRDPARRLDSFASARLTLEQLAAPPAMSRRIWMAMATTAALAVLSVAYGWRVDRRPSVSRSDWVQITNFDSATQPSLSPDGRTLAFIRGPGTFIAPGQVYVKPLPDGEPRALTNDALPKMGPVFSPDGRRISYSVNDGNSWDTWEVDAPGGNPRPWLRNASGLSWTGADAVLVSEMRPGGQMVIVRSTVDRQQSRDLYVPPGVIGMAHRSYASPDGKHVLIVEMTNSVWVPCRLVPSGGGVSQQVGPLKSRCTTAAWSPDGRWMYFTADAGDGFHLWRQRFPDGQPEQITSGPTGEEGVSVTPDGKSLITSVGLEQRSVWFHDSSGDRQISVEGYAYWPLLSADGRHVCFRIAPSGMGQTPSELWVADVVSGEKRRLFPGQLVTGYDVSSEGRVVAAVVDRDGRTRLWVTSIDGREAPASVAHVEGDNPRFGRHGEIVFHAEGEDTGFLFRIRENGDGLERITRVSGLAYGTVSPDGEWLSGVGGRSPEMWLHSMTGRPALAVFPYSMTSRLRWTVDGRYAYMSIQYGQATAFGRGRTYVLPLQKGSILPPVPPGGFHTEAEIAALPGAVTLPYGDLSLGRTPSTYAFSSTTTTRNLYRIPLH